MDQTFQPLPQQPITPGGPFSPQQAFLLKIKAHKTTVIIAGVGVILFFGMITYLVVSPSQKTLVAPITQDPQTTLPTISLAPTLSSASPTSLPPTLTPVPTLPSTSWKTYNNSTYNYSIKYPPDWTLQNIGVLEPLIPSYIVFNSPTATASARNISVSISTRTYAAQLALGASGSATTVAGIAGTKQSFQDSDGNTSTVITLPRTSNLLVLRAKTAYLTIFNQMITTLQATK